MAKSDSLFGYKDEQFCIECSILGQTITSSPVSVTQTSKCMNNLLSKKANSITSKEFIFSSDPVEGNIGEGWQDYFENSDQ